MEMIFFIVYNASGMILRTGNCPIDWLELQASNPGDIAMQVPEPKHGDYWWVNNGEIVTRPQMEITVVTTEIYADGIEYTILTGIPNNTQATITKSLTTTQETITDGSLELSTTSAGYYQIALENFPYISWGGEVHAY